MTHFEWGCLVLGVLVVGGVAGREVKRHRDEARTQAERAAQAERPRRDSIAREAAASQPSAEAVPQRTLDQAYGAAVRAARGIYTLQFVDREQETARAQALARELEAARIGVEALPGEVPSEKVDELRTHNDNAARQLDELNAALGGNPPDFATANARARAIEQEMAEAYNAYRAVAGDPRTPPLRPKLDLRPQYQRVPRKSTAS